MVTISDYIKNITEKILTSISIIENSDNDSTYSSLEYSISQNLWDLPSLKINFNDIYNQDKSYQPWGTKIIMMFSHLLIIPLCE